MEVRLARPGPVTVRRRRHLPVPGEVLVSVGDLVEPQDVVARATASGGLALLNVSRELGAGRRAASEFLTAREGQMLVRDEVLARRRLWLGLRQRTVRAPAESRLLLSFGPWVYLSRSPRVVSVEAGLRGRVAEVHAEWGAVIEARGVRVPAVWGTGGVRSGILRLATEHPEEVLGPERVDERCRGAIVVAGAGVLPRALGRLEELGARGLVSGGLQPGLLAAVRSVSFPLAVTDGFGAVAMASVLWEALAEHHGREATLAGQEEDAWAGEGPEVFVPVSLEAADAAQPVARLGVGARVRIVREPHLGRVGRVEALPERPQPMPSGVRLPAARIALEGGGHVLAARQNLEIVSQP